MSNSVIRYDQALDSLRELLLECLKRESGTWEHLAQASHPQCLVVRDLQGRLRILVRCEVAKVEQNLVHALKSLAPRLGAYAPSPAFAIGASDAPWLAEVFDAPEGADLRLDDGEEDTRYVRFVDRSLGESDWLRAPLPNQGRRPRRAVFFSLKGGVGRSTALGVLARHLSRRSRVLVVDLDLEAPGVGDLLLSEAPRYGVADWYVERLVGQSESYTASDLAQPSAIGVSHEVWVAPVFGDRTQAVQAIGKIGRAQVSALLPGGEQASFADSTARLLDFLEDEIGPDVVLIDSRAGLHPIAAALVSRLDAEVFLFAQDTPQTWSGYRKLLSLIATSRYVGTLRERLKMVAALVPSDVQTHDYRRGFVERSADLFLALYDDETYAPDTGALKPADFTFNDNDTQAPHYPWAIGFHPTFSLFDPLRKPVQLEDRHIASAFAEFLAGAEERLVGDPGALNRPND